MIFLGQVPTLSDRRTTERQFHREFVLVDRFMKTFSGYVELVIERFVIDELLVVLSPRKRFSFGVSALDGVIQSPEFVGGIVLDEFLSMMARKR